MKQARHAQCPSSTGCSVVVGAGGALGGALTRALAEASPDGQVFALSRQFRDPGLDNVTWLEASAEDRRSMKRVAEAVRQRSPRIHRLVVCTGILHDADPANPVRPEKRLAELQPESFHRLMQVNALAPLQALEAFVPLLMHPEPAVAAVLSAMVGSIGDNRLGGWYSYRMSKAALNMGLRNVAIELQRSARLRRGVRPPPIVVAIHPGTTRSHLSEPFLGGRSKARPPEQSARHILDVLAGLDADDNGRFFNWDGQQLPW